MCFDTRLSDGDGQVPRSGTRPAAESATADLVSFQRRFIRSWKV